MSETDDTDDLLLIPPDFFVQDFGLDLQQPYLSVFDSIITQVNKLENRVEHMESSASDLSLHNNGPFNETQNRKDRFPDIDSTHSTPQKPKTKFKLSSLPSSPNVDRYNPTKIRTNLFAPRNLHQDITAASNVDSQISTSKPKSAVLSEIDEFISNVKIIERINKEYDPTKKRLDVQDVNRLMHKLEENDDKQKSENSESRLKYILYKERESKSNESSPNLKKSQPSQTDSYIQSTQDTQTNKAVHYIKSAPEFSQIPSENFTHENKVTLTYKRDTRENIPRSYGDESAKNSFPNIADNLKILSLRDLWSQKETDESNANEKARVFEKLEEEKLRRQHCEHLIQDLQTRILELQERLAVALDVDEAKDAAIVKFHEAWENVGERLKSTNQENIQLKNEIEALKTKHLKEIQETHTRINHYEEEASKALNIAHNSQQKLIALEKQCNEFDSEKNDLEMQLHMYKNKLDDEVNKSKQLTEVIAQKEIELNENKNVLTSARKEVLQSKKAVEVCQQEFASLKSECATLQVQINEKQKKCIELETVKKKLLADVETHKKNEKALQEELKRLRDSMEQHKIDLRQFYQNQVESVVRDKLREFQMQLDRAESLLQEEVKNKEMSIARTAAKHIQSISEKHALEIQLLEEKHKEEVRLYQVQLSQNEQQVQNLQAKFQQQQNRKTQLIEQLHKVMEAQWLEALKIINSSKSSPIATNTINFSTIDQLSTLKSKSYLDFEELLNINEAKNANEGRIETVESCSSLVEGDKGQSQRSPKNTKQSEQELQKCMQMLLSKTAEDVKQKGAEKDSVDNEQQRTSWQFPDQSTKTSSKDRKLGKPPWK